MLWLPADVKPRDERMEAIKAASRDDDVLVFPISSREIAMKEARRPGSLGLSAPPLDVYRFFPRRVGIRFVPLLSAEILAASVSIDSLGIRDPADRMIIASAQATAARIVTGGRKILAFETSAIKAHPERMKRPRGFSVTGR